MPRRHRRCHERADPARSGRCDACGRSISRPGGQLTPRVAASAPGRCRCAITRRPRTLARSATGAGRRLPARAVAGYHSRDRRLPARGRRLPTRCRRPPPGSGLENGASQETGPSNTGRCCKGGSVASARSQHHRAVVRGDPWGSVPASGSRRTGAGIAAGAGARRPVRGMRRPVRGTRRPVRARCRCGVPADRGKVVAIRPGSSRGRGRGDRRGAAFDRRGAAATGALPRPAVRRRGGRILPLRDDRC